jgi:DNA mismatch repair protein MutL
MRIHQLPALIANQIAAGEVIERPASVVKELLENSLDAGADNISIELGFGGLNQIKISDNGGGIFAEDLPLAILAHATSKILSLEDLYNITSMGFRGEALASIASVARVTISSKPSSQKHAMMLEANESGVCITPCARNDGTTIDVRDLFFNAPVRKKFLKTERGELQAIEDVVRRFALSEMKVSISLKHNDKQILTLTGASCEKTKRLRIKKIMGLRFITESLSLDVSHAGISLHGWIGGETYQRSQRDKQWIYINNRMVKDKLLGHAIMQAYQDIMHPGRFPVCLLYLNMSTSEIDVNVHPTKHEVRFQNPRMVHDFIVSSITHKLDAEKVITPINSETRKFEPSTNVSFVRDEIVKNQSSIGEVFDFQDEMEGSRHILNDSFALVFLKERLPYLVNLAGAHNHFSEQTLKNQSYPLASRPLLVPIKYEIVLEHYAFFEKLSSIFLKFGVQYDFISESKIIIRTIPKCLPLLGIKLLFNKAAANCIYLLDLVDNLAENIEENNSINMNCQLTIEFIKLMVASQSFDALQASSDEQGELLEYLQQNKLFANFCVHLDNATCLGVFSND